jgi:hypothetical protein
MDGFGRTDPGFVYQQHFQVERSPRSSGAGSAADGYGARGNHHKKYRRPGVARRGNSDALVFTPASLYSSTASIPRTNRIEPQRLVCRSKPTPPLKGKMPNIAKKFIDLSQIFYL